MRFRVPATVFAVALAVTACGNLPRPFAPESKTVSPANALLPADGAGVVVDGVGCPVSTAEAVVAALLQHQVPATVGPGNRGSMRLVCQGDGAMQSWLLIDADNRRLGEITQESPAGVARSLLALIGRETPSPLAKRPALVMVPIVGAPGDGATALARAMALALEGRGVTLAREPDDTALLVMGSVVVGDPDRGSQFVEVIWELLSPDGARLGIVSQENTIDAGALDGPWGPIAPVIASAGADGVIELIDRTLAP